LAKVNGGRGCGLDNSGYPGKSRFFRPGRELQILGCDACLPAVGAGEKILILKGLADFLHKGLRHKAGATIPAHLHFHGPYLLLGKNLEKAPQADFMPQFSRVFRTRVYAGTAANTLIVGIVEDSKPPLVL
jgi:hypothetical protein